jgi:N-acetyl-gamma-glutamylphosphate reductase
MTNEERRHARLDARAQLALCEARERFTTKADAIKLPGCYAAAFHTLVHETAFGEEEPALVIVTLVLGLN